MQTVIGPHRANSRDCLYYQEAQKIEKEKINRRHKIGTNEPTAGYNLANNNNRQHFPDLNIFQSRAQLRPTQSPSTKLIETQHRNIAIPKYSDITRNYIRTLQSNRDLTKQDASTQTENKQELTMTMEKMALLLVKILDPKIIKASTNKKVEFIHNILKEIESNPDEESQREETIVDDSSLEDGVLSDHCELETPQPKSTKKNAECSIMTTLTSVSSKNSKTKPDSIDSRFIEGMATRNNKAGAAGKTYNSVLDEKGKTKSNMKTNIEVGKGKKKK